MRAVSGRAWPVHGSGRHVVVLAITAIAAASSAGLAFASAPLTLTKLSPTSGPVGTLVALTGTGFVSRDVVMFNGRATSPVSVNSAGTSLHGSGSRVRDLRAWSRYRTRRAGQRASLPNSPFRVTTGGVRFSQSRLGRPAT